MEREFKQGDFVTHPTFGNGLITEEWAGPDRLLVTFVADSFWFGTNQTHSLSSLSHATLPPAPATEPTDYDIAVAMVEEVGDISVSRMQRKIKGCTYKRGVQIMAELMANGVIDPTEGVYKRKTEKGGADAQ